MKTLVTSAAILLAMFAFWPTATEAAGPGKGGSGGGGGNWSSGGGKWSGSGGGSWSGSHGGSWSGGHKHHGHNWHHGHRWYPGYTYGYSRPYIANTTPYVVASPVPTNVAPGPAYSGAPVTIVNPASNNTVLSYSLNGTPYTMQPGQSQQFAEDRAWTIEFSRGGNFGSARYGLFAGQYTFGPTERGWELFSGPIGTADSGGAMANPPPPSFQTKP